MKKIVTLMLLALLVCGATAKTKKDGTAVMRVPQTVWDFGNIKEKSGSASHEFEFYNDGNGNLVILDAKAECGCTRPEYPDKPIAPGKKGKIKVNYNPVGRLGSFEKTVTVRTNGNPKKVYLKIRGKVIP